MPMRCILACSPAPMNAMLFESGRPRCLAARAPIAPTRTLEQRVPSMKAMGKPRSISDRMITADRFCTPCFSGLGGNTDTHLAPHTFSGSRVAGRQLIRSWVSSSKIWTIFSGKRISSLRNASMAFSAALTASRMSRHPASRRSSCERKRHSMRFLSVMVLPFSAVCPARVQPALCRIRSRVPGLHLPARDGSPRVTPAASCLKVAPIHSELLFSTVKNARLPSSKGSSSRDANAPHTSKPTSEKREVSSRYP